MADTQRTRSAILSLFGDNVTGQVSAQDLRDFVVTLMESEFANAGDFWSKPQSKFTTTDRTGRGWKMYSQYIGSATSFQDILYMDCSTGYWIHADRAHESTFIGVLGVAMESYLAGGISTGVILLEGCIYLSANSANFTAKIGMPIYLDSGVSGAISAGPTTLSGVKLGFIMPSDDHGASTIGKWYFKPDWGVVSSQ